MRGGVGCQAAEPSERVDLDLGKVSSGRAGVGRGLVSVGNENCAAAAVLVGGRLRWSRRSALASPW